MPVTHPHKTAQSDPFLFIVALFLSKFDGVKFSFSNITSLFCGERGLKALNARNKSGEKKGCSLIHYQAVKADIY